MTCTKKPGSVEPLTMNHVMIVKEPRKPQLAIIVKKSRLQDAKNFKSTLKVMHPKWKCEIFEATTYGNDSKLPEDVVRQSLLEPLEPMDEDFKNGIMSLMR